MEELLHQDRKGQFKTSLVSGTDKHFGEMWLRAVTFQGWLELGRGGDTSHSHPKNPAGLASLGLYI